MKVVFDHQIFSAQEYGGISRYFCELAKRLQGFPDMNVSVLAPFSINRHVLEPAFESIRPFGWHLPHKKGVVKIARALNKPISRSLLSIRPPDIVHETYYSAESLASQKSKVVITVYDMIHEKMSQFFPQEDATSRLKEAAVRRADQIICISENTRKDLLERIDLNPEKVSVVHLGYTVRAPKASEVQPLMDSPYVLFVGQRDGYKNFSGLLKAVSGSKRLQKDFRILCFGGGGLTSAEKELMRSLSLDERQVVQVSGDDERLAAAYRNAAAFIYPSLYEGFGIPPLEAMSFECPVACSSTSSLPEVAGPAAEYFDPTQEEDVASALERVLYSDGRQAELKEQGHQRIKSFSWDTCASKTREIYQMLRG
jgi:glycosyltransferase involved in cell wall biosynthesis